MASKPKRIYITPDADAVMSKQSNAFMLKVALLLIGVMGGVFMLYSHVAIAPRYRVTINTMIGALTMLPVLFWWRAMVLTLLPIGRKLVKQAKYAEAVVALDPFTRLGNRGFDLDGEAHYLLATAYTKLGQAEKAKSVADYLLRYRGRHAWAKKWSEKN